MDRDRLTTRLALVLAIALGLRLAAAVVLQWELDHRLHRDYLIPGDADGYWQLAENLTAGREYSIYTPPRKVLRMPGFPAFLAASIAIFGDSHLPARLLLAGVGTIACGGVYCLGRALFGRESALAGTAISAALPTFIGFTPLILSETAFAAALVWSLWPSAKLLQLLRDPQPSTGRVLALAALAGVLIGAANYVRPSWLLAAPLIGGLGLIAGKGRGLSWLAGGLVILAMIAALTPWGLRNRRVTGHFVLTTLWVGPSLYDGLNPGATGDSDMTFYDQENKLAEMPEYEVDQDYRRRAWNFAIENRGRALSLAAIKLGRFWNPWPNAEQFSHWPVRLAVSGSLAVLLCLSLVALWWARPGWVALALTIGPVLYFSAVHMVFLGSLRYRLPAEYPLAALAGAGWHSWRARRAGRTP